MAKRPKNSPFLLAIRRSLKVVLLIFFWLSQGIWKMENLTQKDYKSILEITKITSASLDISTIKTNLINSICNLIPSESGVIYMFDSKKQKFHSPVTMGLSGEFCQKFEQEYYKLDYLAIHALKNPKIFLSTNLITNNLSFEQSIAFRELYNPEGVLYALVIPIHVEGKPLSAIGIYRSKHSKNYSAREVLIMELLHPHIRNSMGNAFSFNNVSTQKDLLGVGVDNLSQGILIFDMNFELIFLNKAANDFCREYNKKFLRLGRDLSLPLKREKDLGIPKIIYDNFIKQKECFSHPEKTLEWHPREMLVQIFPLEKYSIKSFIINKEVWLEKTTYYIVIIEDSYHNLTPNYENLKQKYCLTRREIEIIKILLRGYSNAEVADKLSISEETVKVHIKNIFDKLEIKSRMGIVSRILELDIPGEVV